MKWIHFVIIFFVCVLKCRAMSHSEIEDFANFLKQTSQLDLNIKSKTPEDEYDDEELISDNAWEESGKFEGDLILNERQRRLIVADVVEGLSRNGLRDGTKRWPNNEVIYFIQREHFSGDQVQAIQAGIDDIAQASCVKFTPYKKGDRDAVVIQGSRRGCFSQVGFQGGYQVLNLSGRHPVGRGCFRHGTVVHELLHSLGFYHMQSSPDRDDYIDVHWENIIQPARHNFRKYNTFSVSDFGVGYDYDSVLHYSRRAFSSNGRDTLVPKQGGASIGQRVGLSQKDTEKLNKMYCDADSSNDNDETGKRPTKKSRKNKPFQGHGIGYHQGKTVVIKLPTADTYKLPDLPTFHLFDYFSKTPQALSPTLLEGFGAGQKITYVYEASKSPLKEDNSSVAKVNIGSDNFSNNHTDRKVIECNKEQPTTINIVNRETESEKQHKQTKDTSSNESSGSTSDEVDGDLSEAFKRLSKVIKSRVYPSPVYHFDTDYSEFYLPASEGKESKESEPEKVDEMFHLSKVKTSDKYDDDKGDTKKISDNQTSLKPEPPVSSAYPTYKFNGFLLSSAELPSKEIDSSYQKSFPFRYLHKEKSAKNKNLSKNVRSEYYNDYYPNESEENTRDGNHWYERANNKQKPIAISAYYEQEKYRNPPVDDENDYYTKLNDDNPQHEEDTYNIPQHGNSDENYQTYSTRSPMVQIRYPEPFSIKDHH